MENNIQKKEEWSWLKHKPDNMISLECTPDKDFFKWWCIIMNPFMPLTPKETDLVASLLKQRYELSKKILDPVLVDSQLLSNETKNKVIEDCGITLAHFHVLMSSLRSKGIITKAGISPQLIPRVRKDNDGYCQLLLLFKDNELK